MKTGTKHISKEEAKRRAAKLRREIEHHDYLYYVESKPEISDAEYDALVEEFNLVEHRVPMMSIDNISTEDDALEFDKRVKRFLEIEVLQKSSHASTLRDLKGDIGYTAEPKFDGVSASF